MSQVMKLYRLLADACGARKRCIESNNVQWRDRWETLLDNATRNLLPSGSGVDNGCTIDLDKSGEDKIVIYTSFHHMNDGGMYDGWTKHSITVRPTFSDIALSVSGRDRNQIKDYLGEMFDHCLGQYVKWGHADGEDTLELVELTSNPHPYVALVFQAGIANVFSVSRFSTSNDGRRAKRLEQNDFRSCYRIAWGMGEAGSKVRCYGCNEAGDIAAREWIEDLDSLPFSDSLLPIAKALSRFGK
jgi:hypothetical protein